MREIFQHNCAACHTPSFVLQNRFDKAGWRAMIATMEMMDRNMGDEPWPNIHHFKEELADYLAKMRGPGPLRCSSIRYHVNRDAARVVITEYDIPPAETPEQLAVMNGSDWSEGTPASNPNRGTHDVAVDFFGNAWVSSSADNHNRVMPGLMQNRQDYKFQYCRERRLGAHESRCHHRSGRYDLDTLEGRAEKAGSLGRINPRLKS